jgi:hypothetical protein
LKPSSFLLAGGGPKARGLWKRDGNFLIADGRWMVRENAEIGVYTEDSKCKSGWIRLY